MLTVCLLCTCRSLACASSPGSRTSLRCASRYDDLRSAGSCCIAGWSSKGITHLFVPFNDATRTLISQACQSPVLPCCVQVSVTPSNVRFFCRPQVLGWLESFGGTGRGFMSPAYASGVRGVSFGGLSLQSKLAPAVFGLHKQIARV